MWPKSTEESCIETDSVSDAVGVKFFLDDNRRQVTYDDTVVVAIQALKIQ